MVHTLCQRPNGAFERQAIASWVRALRERGDDRWARQDEEAVG